MEISVQEFKHCDMISVKGRVDSATAPQLAQALEAANEGGKYKLVIEMEGLEYMSSAGFPLFRNNCVCHYIQSLSGLLHPGIVLVMPIPAPCH